MNIKSGKSKKVSKVKSSKRCLDKCFDKRSDKRSIKHFNKRGAGLIDKIIDKIPFELHIPKYQYCGPGDYLIPSFFF